MDCVETQADLPLRRQQAVSATQAAALAAARFIGRHNETAADTAAMEAMHGVLAMLPISATLALGEGAPGEAHGLGGSETTGAGGPPVAIALNALEGAATAARGGFNASSVLAIADQGWFQGLPAVYMDKIAVGPGLPPGVIDLDRSIEANIRNVAAAKGIAPAELVVCLLDRSRNDHIVSAAIRAGARTLAVTDGDTGGIIAAALPDSGIDLFLGAGGAPAGVLAAAALVCLGGQFLGRLRLDSETALAEAERWGIADRSRVYQATDLAGGRIVLAVTGVTPGLFLPGVRRIGPAAITESIVMDSDSQSVHRVVGEHPRPAASQPAGRR